MTDGASLADSPKREYRRVWRQAFGVLIATYLIGVVVLSIFSLLGRWPIGGESHYSSCSWR